MTKIGLFYGTQMGNTADIAEKLAQAWGGDTVELHDIAKASPADFAAYEYVIIGCPTWNIGALQSDWEGFFPDLGSVDFTSKKVAYFGPGDQVGYADNFMDAIGILEAEISRLGGKTMGFWPTTGYDFNASKAVKNGKFLGLALDEDNQPELTLPRITAWVKQLQGEFQLS